MEHRDTSKERRRKLSKRSHSCSSSSEYAVSPQTEKIGRKHKRKKVKKRRKDWSSEDSSTSSPESRRRKKKKEKAKEKRRKAKLKKRKLKKEKKLKSQDKKNVSKESIRSAGKDDYMEGNGQTEELITGPCPEKSAKEVERRSMVPMTKEEYEKQQSKVRRVFDPDTGRQRLVKGDGEIIEEVVSYERHRTINKLATSGDCAAFQQTLGLNKY